MATDVRQIFDCMITGCLGDVGLPFGELVTKTKEKQGVVITVFTLRFTGVSY